jgi:hypothetical protein
MALVRDGVSDRSARGNVGGTRLLPRFSMAILGRFALGSTQREAKGRYREPVFKAWIAWTAEDLVGGNHNRLRVSIPVEER